MAKRKTHEELAYTKLKRRLKQMHKAALEIAYDFGDSEAHGISGQVDELVAALERFEEAAEEEMQHYREEYRDA